MQYQAISNGYTIDQGLSGVQQVKFTGEFPSLERRNYFSFSIIILAVYVYRTL